VEAKADYPVDHVREHPAFVYAVLLLASVTIEAAWIVPSPDFNRLAYRHAEGRREILEFRGDPVRSDRYSMFRIPPLEIGPRLLALIDSLDERVPQHLTRGAGLMLAARRKQ
jgi:hypothetical protein